MGESVVRAKNVHILRLPGYVRTIIFLCKSVKGCLVRGGGDKKDVNALVRGIICVDREVHCVSMHS